MAERTAERHGVHRGVGHVVPVRTLVAVLAVLLALTAATLAVTLVDLGPLNLVLALGIAVLKGTLVLLYFMHLRWDRPFNAVVLVSALAFFMIFVALSLMDAHNYQSEVITGYGGILP
jgi:cytochrome c oxidase subunit 4